MRMQHRIRRCSSCAIQQNINTTTHTAGGDTSTPITVPSAAGISWDVLRVDHLRRVRSLQMPQTSNSGACYFAPNLVVQCQLRRQCGIFKFATCCYWLLNFRRISRLLPAVRCLAPDGGCHSPATEWFSARLLHLQNGSSAISVSANSRPISPF